MSLTNWPLLAILLVLIVDTWLRYVIYRAVRPPKVNISFKVDSPSHIKARGWQPRKTEGPIAPPPKNP